MIKVQLVDIEILDQLRVQGQSRIDYELQRSIETDGVKRPLEITYHVHDNKAALSDGHHRLDIAKDLGVDKLPVTVFVSGTDAPPSAKEVKLPDWKGKDYLFPYEIGLAEPPKLQEMVHLSLRYIHD